MPDLDSNALVQGSADATIIAAKGLGVDYTNSMKFFLFGWSQGMAINLGSGNNIFNGANTIKGIGFTNHFNLGLNLSYLQKKKWVNLLWEGGPCLRNNRGLIVRCTGVSLCPHSPSI